MQYGPQYGYGYAFPHPPPPDPPELPEGASPFPRWPTWYGPAAMATGLAITLVAIIVLSVVVRVAGGHPGTASPAFTQIATLIQDAIFVGAAVLFATRTSRPRPWHFGLKRSRLWPTVGWTTLALVGFFVFEIVYSSLLKPSGKQTIVRDLGAKHASVALVTGAVLVILIAPAAEEFFFRGFFYRALRSRLSIVAAALIDGALFGAIHYENTKTVLILPVLAALGFLFCLVYEKTGTLFSTIAMHAVNNAIAYGAATHEGVVSVIVLGFVLTGCLVLPRVLPARVPAVTGSAA